MDIHLLVAAQRLPHIQMSFQPNDELASLPIVRLFRTIAYAARFLARIRPTVEEVSRQVPAE